MLNPIRISDLAWKGRAIALVAVTLAALTAAYGAKAAEVGSWVVASVEGAVSVDGQAAGTSGSAIGPGAVIETGADGNVVLTRPGDSITVFPNSRMSVPEVAGDGESGILQTLGKLLFRMESRESRDFKIKTPYLAAAIKGTTFTVEVDDADAVVEVEEGSVLVTANRSGQSAYVRPGERASVGGDRDDSVRVSEGRDSEGEGSEDGEANETDETDETDEADEADERDESDGGGSSDSPDSPDSPDSSDSPDTGDSRDSPDSPDGGESDESDEKDD
ncbi:MAG: FecR domain-containing protein [Proteobacteria bacterium]|nr:FecR domain-containing protein [Pseudomonadota bacterium]